MRLVAEWKARRNDPDPKPTVPAVPLGQQISINELILAFWPWAQQHSRHADGTTTDEIHGYRSSLRYLRQLYGMTPAAEFSPLKLKACRGQMIRKGSSRRTAGGIARTTANKYTFRIKHLFKWGVENELVSPSVYHGLATVSGLQAGRCDARETEKRRPIPDDAIGAVRRDVPQEVRDLIDLQLLTASRSGELLELTTRDLNRDGEVWIDELARHKTAHRDTDRVWIFGPKAQLILKRYLRADPSVRLFRYRVNSYRRVVTRSCDRLGIKRWSPHWLRHTASTRIRHEHNAEASQVILGHARLQTTELHAQKNVRLAMEIMQRIG